LASENAQPVIQRVLTEQEQGHETRKRIFERLDRTLGRPVVSFFTSFRYPVMMEDADADMLEGVLRTTDTSKGFGLCISSPGGDSLAAERIVNVCRAYSGTGEYWVIVPGKAKSAATMVCFGASKVVMSATSELGPIDPQLVRVEDGVRKWFSVFNLVKSYEDLFDRAVKAKGNLEPFLQQLANYDEREIAEFRAALALSEDIAVRCLTSGMMSGVREDEIKERIRTFLTPERTKIHGRPIYYEEARECGLTVEPKDVADPAWGPIYELYVRTDNFVSTKVAKCIESRERSFVAAYREAQDG